jgi:hypothetical protein
VDIVGVVAVQRQPTDVLPHERGRSHSMSEGDQALHPTASPGWCASLPCPTALLGRDRTRSTAATKERS